MPESSAWPDIRRWELHTNVDEGDSDDFEEEVVVHNELYISEGEEDYNLQEAKENDIEEEEDADSSSQDRVAIADDIEEDSQSHISGISQQDRDNKTILLRQAASGMTLKMHS